MDDNYYRQPRNPVAWGLAALGLGCVGVFVAYFTNFPMIATFLGAAGLLIGGFAFNIAANFPRNDKNRVNYMGFIAAAMMASVIAFMVGFMNWLG